MDFEFDWLALLSGLPADIPSDNPLVVAWWFLASGGWLFLVLAALYYAVQGYKHNRQSKYRQSINYALLAIDVPKDTEQSPQAVEQIFGALSATYVKGTLQDSWIKGKVQDKFSFELVSLGGYTQFLIHTPVDYRDLVEAAIYAQYPDAEITEVEDYINRISTDFDTEAYDLWGTEFTLMKKWVYPIKTYPEFEHTLSQDFKDPMAQLLEAMSRINPDEDVWLQLVVTPIDNTWTTEAAEVVQRIVKHESKSGAGLLKWLFWSLPLNTLYDLFEALIAGVFEPTTQYDDKVAPKKTVFTFANLTPGERTVVEAIERKASKIGFRVKFRMIYWGRRETFVKGRGVRAVVGAIQQFTALNLNGFKPSKLLTTKAEYFLKNSRINRKQQRILRHYKRRSAHAGMGHGVILNTEELATVYHFPVITVKAPLVRKTEGKKAEPPFALPVMRRKGAPLPEEPATVSSGRAPKGAAPANIPFVE